MQIILIGNYVPDKQESMQRFAYMLENGFSKVGIETQVWYPPIFFGNIAKITGLKTEKWLGYVDKWIVFPLILRWRLLKMPAHHAQITKFHICDHSNSPYFSHLPINKTSITCHDVLAIKGGLGHDDAYVSASRLGKFLQAWILNNLSKAERLATVSKYTLDQLRVLTPHTSGKNEEWRVIHNAFNADFFPMPVTQAHLILKQLGIDSTEPFILHVGSGLARKNRLLLLDMAALLGDKWQGNICFAGEALDSDLLKHADALGLSSRVISIVKPEHNALVALYSTCFAFLFPSLSEGFGWPLIEAQACGAPVITSNVAPMPEVCGGAAFYGNPANAQSFANEFLKLEQDSVRNDLIQAGFINCQRFEPQQMIKSYIDLIQH